ncbi:Glucose dehydrogenase [FAD, quinone] [Orchesella cincta]|uniref:Glucose dehydrogenase [FAD, quinone] n=1 Tax=Orchesella cincta TaxID=48709 RepID=A0A1D2M557_ORCCI|nr:Glucose dehydrogenase [FAD, quinone] [Orchesella cincta]
MLGGSTSTNFMMYVRGKQGGLITDGHTEDLGGDPQWNYENLLPYFKKSEDYNGAWVSNPDASTYHGKGGLRNVATYDFQPGVDEFLAAAQEKGYTLGDYNVFSKIDVTTQDGWRESTYRSFYKDTGKPSNLCIKKYALVTKINFETVSEKPKAFSVTYQRQGLIQTVTATKEIILSAGIPLVKDLPVGAQLQDHVTTIVGPFLKSPGVNPNRDLTVQAATEFLKSGTGLLAAPGALTGQGFIKSPVAQPDYADIQMVHASASLYPKLPKDLNKMFGPRVDILENWFDPYHKQNVDARFGLLILGRPKSVGELRMASRNPDDNPIMDLQYLRHPDDVEALLFGFKKFVDLYENTALRCAALNTTLFPKPVPGCESLAFKSDDYY